MLTCYIDFYRISLWLVVSSAIVFGLLWMVLASSLFSGFRKDLVAGVLTDQMGQSVVINGDVRLNPGVVSEIYVSGVEIPSENIPDQNLAELSLLELELDLLLLAQGNIEFNNLIVDGLGVNLLHLADGRKSWSERETASINHSEEAPEERGTRQYSGVLGGQDSGVLEHKLDPHERDHGLHL